jgi:hypothetical protein
MPRTFPEPRLRCYAKRPRALRLGLGLAALLLTALDHIHGYHLYLRRLNTNQTLLPELAPPPEIAAGPAPARRVVVIFLDGLDADTAAGLPELQELLAAGAHRALAVDFPSFTYPAAVAFATGVPPRYSGVRLNFLDPAEAAARERKLPSLLDAAVEAEIPVRIAGGDGLHDLIDARRRWPEIGLDELLEPGQGGRALDWIYFGAIDEAGHHAGAASPRYLAAAREGAQLVARVAGALDLSRDAVVVVSDHGHMPRGGHGGAEPAVRRAFFLALGAGVRAGGGLPPRSYLDVAPTVAALLGLSPPAKGLGRPMLDVVDAPGPAVLAPAFARRLAVEAGLAGEAPPREAAELLAALRRGDVAAVEPAERLLDNLALSREGAYHRELDARSLARLRWAAPLVLLAAALAWWLARRGGVRLAPRDALPAATYAAVYLALYFGAGYGVSFSIPRGEAGFYLETLVYGLLAALAARLVSRRLSKPPRLAEETLVMLLAFGPPYLLASAWVGLDPAYLARPFAGFLVPFAATLGFYGHGPYGIALLASTLRRPAPAEEPAELPVPALPPPRAPGAPALPDQPGGYLPTRHPIAPAEREPR